MNLDTMKKIAHRIGGLAFGAPLKTNDPRGMLTPRGEPDYKKRQALRAETRVFADSRVIRLENLVLRTVREWRGGRVRRTGNVLEEREAWQGILSADGKPVGIKARLRDSVKRAVRLGLGRMRRASA